MFINQHIDSPAHVSHLAFFYFLFKQYDYLQWVFHEVYIILIKNTPSAQSFNISVSRKQRSKNNLLLATMNKWPSAEKLISISKYDKLWQINQYFSELEQNLTNTFSKNVFMVKRMKKLCPIKISIIIFFYVYAAILHINNCFAIKKS